ncbi:hypothetical protein ACS0TY_017999 [Phlomoides rotata]
MADSVNSLSFHEIFVKDVWKEYTGWPLSDMESQYKFMVKHVQLWNLTFHSTSPKWIHSVYQQPLRLRRTSSNTTSQVAIVGSNVCPIESFDYDYAVEINNS